MVRRSSSLNGREKAVSDMGYWKVEKKTRILEGKTTPIYELYFAPIGRRYRCIAMVTEIDAKIIIKKLQEAMGE